jgi:hypothetical protein
MLSTTQLRKLAELLGHIPRTDAEVTLRLRRGQAAGEASYQLAFSDGVIGPWMPLDEDG